jgi:Glycosyl hydrolase family 115/Gylcosyl hydrolase family 115 C-terminal domain
VSLSSKKLVRLASILACCLTAVGAHALGGPGYVTITPDAGSFCLVQNRTALPFFVSPADWPGVIRAVGDLSDDTKRVTDVQPSVVKASPLLHETDAVLIGTIGRSPMIDELIRQHKLDVSGVAGKWESAVTTVVDHPMAGVRRALVIAGSDKRGTIFGIYDLSEQIGVSPWYWWADVRVPHRDALFVTPGRHVLAEPAVKYRGIFLNDEAPSLAGWVNEKFGGYNSKFYVHVFELLLRLKANYLWPAMWNSTFNEDDPENPRLADEYGIVMGTSHHEPMLRAQQEWKRHGTGPWDYSANANVLDDFWRKGIERNKNYESTITLGMRGDGDMPMTEGANIALLEKIVADQRAILQANMTPTIQSEPKIWALYKEVQEYYEKGMRVPDDVTLLWCDDNWGNIRRLPTQEEQKRSGGAGIYYHFDYVGGPRSYKWLNTYSINKVWEQMNLALNYGADRVWVVNVGDLKPMEFPIEFFLSMAHSPQRWGKDNLAEFTRLWAAREFGEDHAAEIANALDEYTRFNARRKPEQLEPTTFSLTNYEEADRVDAGWRSLAKRVDELAEKLPKEERASFFELVQYPVDASATVNEMYIAAGRNALYARQGRASANNYAAETRALFAKDAKLTDAYNHLLLNGRWNHMMDQTHIGYTFWNEPPLNTMPAVTEVQVPEKGAIGVATQDGLVGRPSLGIFDSVAQQVHSLTLFNRGKAPVDYRVTTSDPWIVVDQSAGIVDKDEVIKVHVDWSAAPPDRAKGTVTVLQQDADPINVQLESLRLPDVTRGNPQGFVESEGYVAINAVDTTHRAADRAAHWEELPGYGETHSAMTVFPVTAPSNTNSTAELDYRFYLYDAGKVEMQAVLAPTLNFAPGRGLRFAVSVDDGPRTIVDALAHNTERDWETAISDGVKKVSVPLSNLTPGYHTLKIWIVDPGVVLERIFLSHGPLRPGYLGPPESFHGQMVTH